MRYHSKILELEFQHVFFDNTIQSIIICDRVLGNYEKQCLGRIFKGVDKVFLISGIKSNQKYVNMCAYTSGSHFVKI